MLSIIIPVYNEKPTLEKLLEAVEASAVGMPKEIIIVDDFSTDGTREILKKLEEKKKYTIIYHDRNQGKGAALRTGFKAARGTIIITQDADLEYDPGEYKIIIEPLLKNEADVVYGSRFTKNDTSSGIMGSHYLGNKFLTRVSNMFTRFTLTDMETGYKAFSRASLEKILPHITSDRFGIEPELTARIAKNKLRLIEVPISYFARTKAEGKKIRWRDGFPALWAIVKFNLFN